MTLAGSTLCAVVGANTAWAHTSPISSEPRPNSTVAALPEELEMTFDGPILASSGQNLSMLVVADPMHEFINAPTATVEDNTLSTVLSPSMLMYGEYTVSFRAFGSDGHVSQGSWTFTVDSHVDGQLADAPEVPVPETGSASVTARAIGTGVMDAVGSPTGAATGTFDIDFATSTMCYQITSTGLGDVVAGHIHSASLQNMTISDEIYLPIDLAAVNAKTPVCAKQDLHSLANLAADPGRFVLMIHTVDYPDGAAAGPLRPASATASTTSDPPESGGEAPEGVSAASAAQTRSLPNGPWLIVGTVAVGLLTAGTVGLALRRRSLRVP
jgi:methionine-rich copper-binding protein CopC